MLLPDMIESEAQLEDVMTTSSSALIEAMRSLDGDLLILGVGGKMGPTLARLARRALDQAGNSARVIGVARFTNPAVRERLEDFDIETVTADLLDDDQLANLPDAPNVIYLAARKFGSTGNEPLTWAMNTYLPARVASRYRNARIVALSTGNVYPFTPVDSDGPDENHPLGPVGEYAQSCLGRERMLQYLSRLYQTPVAIIRLNYAIDLRYGVLLDIAAKVHTGKPIDLTMGHANVIWQGDANAAILRSLAHCTCPPFVLNVTGSEVISVREVAITFGGYFNKEPVFNGTEAPTSLLSNAARHAQLMGPPTVPLERMVAWTAHWIRIGGATLDKPTHYQTRDGSF